MSDTTFTNGVTLTDADWFNDLNRLHYTIFGDPATTTAAVGSLVNGATEDTAPDKIADFVPSYDASAATGKKLRLVTALARAMPPGQGLLVNGKITFSVAANALTIAVKGDDGNDPSATNPVYAFFRKASLTDSGFDIIPITAALSVVISSGSTLGHASAIAQHVFAYLINNAGTAELAASNLPPDYPGTFGKARLVSTTAEGGAGAADSATGVYSTTARSNVPWICVAKALGTQATAGTWATAMTQVDAAPFVIPSNNFHAYASANWTTSHGANATAVMDAEVSDPDGVFNTTTYRHQPNVAGWFEYHAQVLTASSVDQMAFLGELLLNGATLVSRHQGGGSGTTNCGMSCSARYYMNGTTDFMLVSTYQASGGNIDILGSYSRFSGGRCTNGEAS